MSNVFKREPSKNRLAPAENDSTTIERTSSRFAIHENHLATSNKIHNMATVTMTETVPKGRRLPKNVKLPPENERYMRACADIASALIQDYEAQANGTKAKKDLNLNQLRGQIAKKHYLKSQPPLTAIIAAVPEHYKKYILPKLIAKPIRMFSNRRDQTMITEDADIRYRHIIRYCSGGGNVQTASLSAHFIHWKHLRLLPRRAGLRL